MCKHILNAQVYMLSSCCNLWYECSECHDENLNETNFHIFEVHRPLKLCCKSCQVVFQVNLQYFSEKDKLCPNCDNCWCRSGNI